MSLKPEPIGPIPPETIRVAKAACPKGSTFIRMRDELGVLFQDEMSLPCFLTTVNLLWLPADWHW